MLDDDDDSADERRRRFRGAGGTPGGVPQFLIGVVMVVVGAYVLTNRVTVATGFWSLWGYNAFGLSLIPLIFGIGILFFNGRSIIGWLLTSAGVIFILTGIIMNLQIYFQQTSLFNTLIIIVLLAGGVGLIARSLKAH